MIGTFHINVWIQCLGRKIGRSHNTRLTVLHGGCHPEPRGGHVLESVSDHTQCESKPALAKWHSLGLRRSGFQFLLSLKQLLTMMCIIVCWWWKGDSATWNDISPCCTVKWVRKTWNSNSDHLTLIFSPPNHSHLSWFYLTFIALLEMGKVLHPFCRWPNQNLVLLWKRKVTYQKDRAGIWSQVFWSQTPYVFSCPHKLHGSIWIPRLFAAETLMILTYLIPNRSRKGGGSFIVDAVLEWVESSWGRSDNNS